MAGGLPAVGREPPHRAAVPLHVARLLLPHERLPREPRLRVRQGDPVLRGEPLDQRDGMRAHHRRRGAGEAARRRVRALLRPEEARAAEVQARRLHHRGRGAARDRHPHGRETRAGPRPRVRGHAVGGAEAGRSPAMVQQDALRDAPFLVEAGLHRPDAPLDRRRLHDRRPPDAGVPSHGRPEVHRPHREGACPLPRQAAASERPLLPYAGRALRVGTRRRLDGRRDADDAQVPPPRCR